MKAFYLVAALGGLAACSGGGGSGGSAAEMDTAGEAGMEMDDPVDTVVRLLSPANRTQNVPFETVIYNPGSDSYTVEFGGRAALVGGNPMFDIGRFDTGTDSGGTGVLQSRSDDATVTLTVLSGGATGVRMERLTETAMPTVGTASYSGDYAAVVVDDTSGDVDLLLSGDVALDLDFAADTFSGNITNRVARDPSDNSVVVGLAAGDMTIANGTLSDAGFLDADLIGGSLDLSVLLGRSPTVTSDGRLRGLVAGATASETVGAALIVHTDLGADVYYEEGAFAADQ